uniref:Immunoglobulin V-set domain-containing protein n=1 Tax=Oryzias melastigma TaxID=30732 RepID=A0A3B3DGT1_ORYME
MITFYYTFQHLICEELTAVKKEESTLEGAPVTLSYKYPKLSRTDYFFWYRQFPGKPPEFFFSHFGSEEKIQSLDPRCSHEVKAADKLINLQISSAAVSDSAVYYCAVRPTVTGNNNTLYKNLQTHNTPQHPLEGGQELKHNTTQHPLEDQRQSCCGRTKLETQSIILNIFFIVHTEISTNSLLSSSSSQFMSDIFKQTCRTLVSCCRCFCI